MVLQRFLAARLETFIILLVIFALLLDTFSEFHSPPYEDTLTKLFIAQIGYFPLGRAAFEIVEVLGLAHVSVSRNDVSMQPADEVVLCQDVSTIGKRKAILTESEAVFLGDVPV